MSAKKKLLFNAIFYLLFPILGTVLGLFVFGGLGDGSRTFGQGLWVAWSLMIFGFVYFLGYDYFWGRNKLRRFFRVLGVILNVAFTAFTVFVTVFGHGNELRCGFPSALKFGLIYAPILFGLYRRFVYDLAYKCYFNDTTNLIITVAFPFICYVAAVALTLIHFLWAGLVLVVVSYIAGIYYKGYLKGIKKFFVNFAFYLALMIVGISLGLNTFDLKFSLAMILGWIGVFCAFFLFLAYDLWKKEYDNYDESNTFFTYVGIITTAVLGVLATAFAFGGAQQYEMGMSVTCGFKDAFKYALCFTPILFTLLRFPFYFSGFRKRWNSLMQITVTLLLPVVCYVLSVIFLLIGFLWGLLAIVAVLTVLGIAFAAKRVEVKIPVFIDNGGKDEEENDADIDGTYLDSYLRDVSEPSLMSGYRWKPYTFNVSLIGTDRIYVSGTVYCLHKDLWVSASFTNTIRREIVKAIDRYRAEPM